MPFLYGQLLGQKLDWVQAAIHPKRPKRLPKGTAVLVVKMPYGTGLRLTQARTLRVKDIDFEYSQIVVRNGQGQKDRRTVLPRAIREQLLSHLDRVRQLHEKDLTEGAGRVALPDALVRKGGYALHSSTYYGL